MNKIKLFKHIAKMALKQGYEISLETKGKHKVVGDTETLTIKDSGVILRVWQEVKDE